MQGNITLEKTSKVVIGELMAQHYQQLLAPMDDMWEEAIIGVADFYRIIMDKSDAGYFCIDKNNALLQFFTSDEFAKQSAEVFRHLLEQFSIAKGFVSTIDPGSLPLFLDFNKGVSTYSFLYRDYCCVELASPLEGVEVSLAVSEELPEVLEYHHTSAGITGSWLEQYCAGLIAKQQLFLFKINGEIIGTGERRLSERQKEYANLGVTVAQNYRRRGLASYILSYLKADCYKHSLKPICSTSISNIGSQKAIEKAGFVAQHRILAVQF